MVREVAKKVFIPFTVGGGIRTVDDFRQILREGADKVAVYVGNWNEKRRGFWAYLEFGELPQKENQHQNESSRR